MKILEVQPKDIYVTFEMSLHEIDLLLEYLNHCTANFKSKEEPKMVEAKGYIEDTFKNLEEFYRNITSKEDDKN